MVCFLCTVVTAQATTPTAYNYDISTYTIDVATTPTATNAATYQAYAGYSAYSQTDATSSVVASNIPTSSICFINAHGIASSTNGNGGGIILGKTLGSDTYLVANQKMPGINPQNQEILYEKAQQTNLLMVFVSCYSADTAPIGNLLDAAQSKGVDCAIGFSGTIDNTKSNHWANKFWEHVSYDGQKISDASTNAVNDATWIFPWGLSLGVNNVEIRGSGQGNIYITPARFGNW